MTQDQYYPFIHIISNIFTNFRYKTNKLNKWNDLKHRAKKYFSGEKKILTIL